MEYQALGRWFVTSGGSDFRSYLVSHCPHLYSDFRAGFASGSSRFLAALSSSASLPLPSSSVTPSVSSLSPPSQPPVAPVPVSFSLAPSAPSFRFPAPLLPPLSSSAPSALPPVFRTPAVSSSSSSLSLPDWHAVAPGLAAVPVPPPVLSPSLFRPFAADPAPSVLVPAAPLSSALPSAPSSQLFFRVLSSSEPPPFLAASSSSFVAPDELPEDAAPDALPRYADSVVPESVRSKFRRMLSFFGGSLSAGCEYSFCCSSSLRSFQGFLWLFCSFLFSYLLVEEPCPSGLLVCFPHGLLGAETQAVLPVPLSCVLFRGE